MAFCDPRQRTTSLMSLKLAAEGDIHRHFVR
jgi:hypothetical protein